MKKVLIIINGAGGAGKDTLIEFAEREYKIRNASAITPIKEAGAILGWEGDKSLESRKFLSDLKMLSVAYNNYPTNYLIREYEDFLGTDEEIMFMHIREIEEIKKMKERIPEAVTLLIQRDTGVSSYGNTSDDSVEEYLYNFYFDNNKSLDQAEKEFLLLMKLIRSCDCGGAPYGYSWI